MRLSLLAFLTAAGCFMAIASFGSGGVDSGGGRSVVCLNGNKSIKSAEMLDLYEGRILYDWIPPKDKRPYKAQLSDAVARIRQSRSLDTFDFSEEFEKELDKTQNNIKFVKSVSLVPIDDSHEIIRAPSGCAFIQVANYSASGRIFIVKKIWDAMSETSKASLIFHETIYSMLRFYGEENSVRARRITAATFAGKVFKVEPLPEWYVRCTSKKVINGISQTRLFLYVKDGFVVAQVDTIEGRMIFGTTLLYVVPSDSSVHVGLKRESDAQGPKAGFGAGISEASPIDMETGIKVQFKTVAGGRVDFFSKAIPKADMNDPNIDFKADDQLTCLPSNTAGIDEKWWLEEFAIRTPGWESHHYR